MKSYRLEAGLAAATLLTIICLHPIRQDPSYHNFADQRTLLGVPNFWNDASNVAFLLVAIWGLRALRSPLAFVEDWERRAYGILLGGLALVSLGSGYYHLRPDDARLFWDRLPMTIVFMALFAVTIGERISMRAGQYLLAPLLALGAISVLSWRFSGDLRLYLCVQFIPMVALPWMWIRFAPRYDRGRGAFWMLGFYALAKIL